MGSFFMVGGLVKMSPAMVGRRRKILKLHWLKRPKTPKTVPENEIGTRE